MTIDRDRRRRGRDESVHRSEPRDQVIDRSAHAGLDLVGARPILGHGRRLREDSDVPAPVGLRHGRHLGSPAPARTIRVASLEFAHPSGTVYVRPPKSGSQAAPGSSLGTMYWDWYVPASSSARHSSLGHPASHQTPGTALKRAAQSSEPGVMVSVRPVGDSDQEYTPTSPSLHPSHWQSAQGEAGHCRYPKPTSSGDGWSPTGSTRSSRSRQP